jgi:ABC-type Zn uptake system ZnuABC Zn-binding protein ZnuA
MRNMILACAAATLAAGGASVRGAQDRKLAVACTLPIVEALAREVGGDDFEYFSLCKADQDPHYVRATPLLQRKLRQADLFIEVGLQLELWADLVADDSGKPRLQKGGAGRIVSTTGIPREQIPEVLTRAAGHVHPDGNPHVWLDPVRGIRMAENIARALGAADPGRKEAVEKRLGEFRRRVREALFGAKLLELAGADELERRHLDGSLRAWLEKEELDGRKLSSHLGGWLKKTEPLVGRKALEFHLAWIYTARAFGFEITGSIEEKPGIPPGPKHQVELGRRLKQGDIAFILVDNFYDPSLPNTLSKDTGVPTLVLPNQPGGEPGTETYVKFFDTLVEKLVAAVKK